MKGLRYYGYIYIDGNLFTNQLVRGVAGKTKKEVFEQLHRQALESLPSDYKKLHNVEYRVWDRSTEDITII